LPLAVEGEHHVVGVEVARGRESVHAGVELHSLAQLEGDGPAAVGDLPALREGRFHFRGAARELGELVEDRARRIEAGAGGVERRGEVLGRTLGAVDKRLGEGGRGQQRRRGRQNGGDCSSHGYLFAVRRLAYHSGGPGLLAHAQVEFL